EPVAEGGLLARFDGVDIRRPKFVNVGKPRREERLLGCSLVASERHPASSGGIRAIPAQEGERRVRAAAAQNARELDRVVYGDRTEVRVRYRTGVRPQAKSHRMLTRKCLHERGAVSEVSMQHLVQLGMRYAKLPAADRRHTSNIGVVKRIAEGVSADHSRRTHDDQTFLA